MKFIAVSEHKNQLIFWFLTVTHVVFFKTDANKEKEVRSTLKSEMQRLINTDDILILDAGNYIKGTFFHS